MTASTTFKNLPEDKRQRVLEEAGEEFAASGYQGASMNRLTSRLGIAKGSLFKYFGSKEGCFRAVFDFAVERFASRMRETRNTSSGDFFQTLDSLLAAATYFASKHPSIYRIYLKMLFNEDFPMRTTVLAEVRANVRKLLMPLLEKARDREEIRPDIDLDVAVFCIDAVLDRYLQASVANLPGIEVKGIDFPQAEETGAISRKHIVHFLRQCLAQQEEACSKPA